MQVIVGPLIEEMAALIDDIPNWKHSIAVMESRRLNREALKATLSLLDSNGKIKT
jgi:hypothetical protein